MTSATTQVSCVKDHVKTFDEAYDAHLRFRPTSEVEDILARAFKGEALQKALKAITGGAYHA